MTGEGFHSSLARDDTGPAVSDATSAAAASKARCTADLVNARLVNSRSVARMSALPVTRASVAWLPTRVGMSVFLIKRTNIGQNCPTRNSPNVSPAASFTSGRRCLQRVRVDSPVMKSQNLYRRRSSTFLHAVSSHSRVGRNQLEEHAMTEFLH